MTIKNLKRKIVQKVKSQTPKENRKIIYQNYNKRHKENRKNTKFITVLTQNNGVHDPTRGPKRTRENYLRGASDVIWIRLSWQRRSAARGGIRRATSN